MLIHLLQKVYASCMLSIEFFLNYEQHKVNRSDNYLFFLCSIRSFSKAKGTDSQKRRTIPLTNLDGVVVFLKIFGVNLDTKVMFLFTQHQIHQKQLSTLIIHFYEQKPSCLHLTVQPWALCPTSKNNFQYTTIQHGWIFEFSAVHDKTSCCVWFYYLQITSCSFITDLIPLIIQ